MGLIEMRINKFEALCNLCLDIKNSITKGEHIHPNMNDNLKDTINDIFKDYECGTVILTNNTDKQLFGIYVNPTVLDSDMIKIVATDEKVELKKYNVEIDLKLFDIVDSQGIAAFIVEEISTIMGENIINQVRYILDLILMKTDSAIEIKQSINYSQILTFAIKDTMNKVGSLIYKDEDAIGVSEYAEAFEIKDILIDTTSKVKSCIFGDVDVTTEPSLGILQWALMIYTDIELHYQMAEDTLLSARPLTASVLEQREIDKTLKCIRRASNEVLSEASLLESTVLEFSLFANLKKSGLRSIEDDLYEYKIRLKNCEDEDEAMYILRQVNTRINILDDYIENTDLSDAELKRWRNLSGMFRDLRYELAKKKLGNKKQYGIFVDYDKLDQLDPPKPGYY